MNQQYKEEYNNYDYSLEEKTEEIYDPMPKKKKYTPLWAWIPFSISVLCYMFIYLFLFCIAIDSFTLADTWIIFVFLIPAIGLEYLVRNKMNQQSIILKILRWLLVIIYGGLTLLYTVDLFFESAVLSFLSILAFAAMIGMCVALIYQIKNG